MPREACQALVIVDMQVDYFNDSQLEQCREDLVAACNTLIERARAAGAPVFEVRTVHAADRSTWALNMQEDGSGMVIAGTPGAEPVRGLQLEGTTTVHKTRDSAFFGTDLEQQLARRGATSMVLAGVSTESCILMTAADAYARDIRVVLAEEALASIDPQLHRRTLEQLDAQYRQPAVSCDDVDFEAPPQAISA